MHIWWLGSEQSITFYVKENTLEDMFQVEQTITTTIQDLDFVIEAFDETAVGSVDKEIGDLFRPMVVCLDEFIKASQSILVNPIDPGFDFAFSNRFRDELVKDLCQLPLEIISRF